MSFGACRLLLSVLVELSVCVVQSKPLFVGLVVEEASKHREVEDASVKIVEFLAGDCGFQLGFSFRVLVCCVDAVEIGVSEFPGQVEEIVQTWLITF